MNKELWLSFLVAMVNILLVSGQINHQMRNYYPEQYNRRIYDYVDNKYYSVPNAAENQESDGRSESTSVQIQTSDRQIANATPVVDWRCIITSTCTPTVPPYTPPPTPPPTHPTPPPPTPPPTYPTPPPTHPTKPPTCPIPSLPPHTNPTYPSITFSTNCDFCDHTIYTLKCIPNAFECATLCANDRKCTHFTYVSNLNGGTCFLKSAPGSGGAWASHVPAPSFYTCGYIPKRCFSNFLLGICLGLDIGIGISK